MVLLSLDTPGWLHNGPHARRFRRATDMNSPAQTLIELLETPSLPDLGSRTRGDALSENAVRAKVDQFLHQSNLTKSRHDLVMSAALLWHDHLDESHTISQSIHSVDGSFLHAIMHRREPDSSNSKYWWHRVGSHACFPELAQRAGEFLDRRGQGSLIGKLAPGGDWDPFAFVDACEHARHRGSAQEVETLKELQRIEFEVFVEHMLAGR